MKILAIDTTSNQLLVGLITQDKHQYISHSSHLKRHNATLLVCVEELLENNNLTLSDIDCLVAVVGPGSFTGIRLGVATTNGLAKGLNIPIISLNALEIMAVGEKGRVLSIIDANHQNYYVGIYNDGREMVLDNFTLEQVQSFDGSVISRDDSFLLKLAELSRKKYTAGDTVLSLTPLYLKLSQAERELNGNN